MSVHGAIGKKDESYFLSLGSLCLPDPQALLNATIFFDYRPLYGDDSLANELRAYLRGLTKDQGAFLRLLANNALMASPPIGLLREFITESGEGNTKHIDLKKFGSRLFVDAARIFALATGSPETSTISRLRTAGPKYGLHANEIASTVQAFTEVQRMRMSNQSGVRVASNGNLLQPKTMHRLDRKILRESLLQAQGLQLRLRQTYAL